MAPDTVSVIIPAYNGERYLGEAIDSILRQTHAATEVIVVDDGSTDDSARIAASFAPVRLIRKVNSGLSATLNVGIAHSTCEFLAFLDQDDRWLPEKLASQIAAIKQDPDMVIVFGHCQRFRSVGDADGGLCEEMLDTMPGVAKSAMLISRNAFSVVGGFAENSGAHDFVDWYGRACNARLRTVVLPEVVYQRRIHGENMTILDRPGLQSSYLAALRGKVTRQRQNAGQRANSGIGPGNA